MLPLYSTNLHPSPNAKAMQLKERGPAVDPAELQERVESLEKEVAELKKLMADLMRQDTEG